ncbi:MAG TPA: ATP-binding protein [Verrucomicrobiae bacterium]|jgi:signal transduction histidine kinase/CheY-like chemotaxis protein
MQFQKLTLKRKLTGIIFLTSLSALFLTCLMLLYYEVISYRQTVARNLSTMADIIAANSSEILIFNDQKLAGQILSDLQVEPEITVAALYDVNGKLFATYPSGAPARDFPSTGHIDGVHFQSGFLTLYTPIYQGQSRVGTLYLKSNLHLKEHLKVYALVLLVILAGAGGVAWLLSIFFQRQISQPLLQLADVAKAISNRKDFSVRAVKTSEDELGDLTDAFNSMLHQIQQSHEETLAASRAKDDFLAALSHELRTPLNPVLLLASDAAVNSRLPPAIRADFEMIRRNVELEARLIDDLLDLTRITRGKLALELKLVDLHDVLREAALTVSGDAREKHIELVLDLRAEKTVVLADAVRLEQIFWNVVKNAVKFTPENGKITVKSFGKNDTAVVKVIDTGIGIKPGELAHVFDAFSQGEHANGGGSHRFGGLGLGLAISRMLVELHHGSIHAESAGSGKGATFIIELPLAKSPVNAEPIPKVSPTQPPLVPESNAMRPLSILLVEDHGPTRTTLAQLLRHRNYEVTTAASLTEARLLAAADHKIFDLLISDIGLPDGSGYDLMMEMRQSHPGIHGIALTGYGMEQDLARSQSAGFAIHLTKPVGIESLEKALKVIP